MARTPVGVCKPVSERYVTGRVREQMYWYRVRSVIVQRHCRYCIRFFMRLILAFRCLLLRRR